jgi:hypothetical protein
MSAHIEAKPPKVVVIPTARPTFVVPEAQARANSARSLLTELGADVVGPTTLVMTPEDVEAARVYFTDDIDIVVNVCASFSDATPALNLYGGLERPLITWSFREPGPVGDRLWLNSLCGANLYAHALVRVGGDVRLIYGDTEEPAVRKTLVDLLAGQYPEPPQLQRVEGPRSERDAVQAALQQLRGSTIGVIGDAPPGFTPSEFEPSLLENLFGITVDQISIDDTFARIDAVPPAVTDSELAALAIDRPTTTALNPQEVAKHAAVTSAFRVWKQTSNLDAIAVRCWPEFPTQRGVCPCSSLSRLADEGTPTVCERDVYGAATMLLMETLGSGTTYLVDTVDLDTSANLVRLWHCGAAATALAAQNTEATQFVHCNRKIGVAGNFPLRTGPVVIARLTEDTSGEGTSGLRLLLAQGESIPATNRFQGNTADVRLDIDAAKFVHTLVHLGFPHHTVMAWHDIRPQLRTAADLLDIPVFEW